MGQCLLHSGAYVSLLCRAASSACQQQWRSAQAMSSVCLVGLIYAFIITGLACMFGRYHVCFL